MNHYKLAKLYEQKQRNREAVAEYEKFLDILINAVDFRDEIEDAKKRLSNLSKLK